MSIDWCETWIKSPTAQRWNEWMDRARAHHKQIQCNTSTHTQLGGRKRIKLTKRLREDWKIKKKQISTIIKTRTQTRTTISAMSVFICLLWSRGLLEYSAEKDTRLGDSERKTERERKRGKHTEQGAKSHSFFRHSPFWLRTLNCASNSNISF